MNVAAGAPPTGPNGSGRSTSRSKSTTSSVRRRTEMARGAAERPAAVKLLSAARDSHQESAYKSPRCSRRGLNPQNYAEGGPLVTSDYPAAAASCAREKLWRRARIKSIDAARRLGSSRRRRCLGPLKYGLTMHCAARPDADMLHCAGEV